LKMLKPFLAEFIGTFFLCFAGIAAILSATSVVGGGGGLVAIALAHGLALSVAVSVFGGISGAHLNPAVTLGILSTGRIKGSSAAAYIISQCLGSAVAAALCKAIFPADATGEANLGIPLPGHSWAQSASVILLVEFILTFLLLTAVFGTAVDERGKPVKIGAFAIGLTVTFDILAGGPVTGASMNPARSFGPALVQGFWSWHWCYWVGPILGALAASLLYHHVLLKEDKPVEI
jgi:MIP family channel proteins